MHDTESVSAKTGRPRSKELDLVVLDAVLDLIGDGASLNSISLIGLSRHTGISRNAMYRRWLSKEDLYLELLTTIEHRVPALNAQSARDNLVALMNAIAERVADPRIGRMVRAVNAEAGSFPDLHQYFVSHYVAPFRDAMRSTIRRGKETGEIRVDVNEDTLAYLLLSSNLSHITVGMNVDFSSPLTSDLIVDVAFEGVAPR